MSVGSLKKASPSVFLVSTVTNEKKGLVIRMGKERAWSKTFLIGFSFKQGIHDSFSAAVS